MAETAKQFAERALRQPSGSPRDAIIKDRQQTGQAFMLRVRFKGARRPVVVTWGMFSDGDIEDVHDEQGQRERLTLLFAHRVVFIEGHHLEKLLDEFETERATIIQEHDEKEAMALEQSNATASEEAVKPIILSVDVQPPLQTRINDVLKTEMTDESQHTGYPERRLPAQRHRLRG